VTAKRVKSRGKGNVYWGVPGCAGRQTEGKELYRSGKQKNKVRRMKGRFKGRGGGAIVLE